MTRLAVFASGRGSNLARIQVACREGELPAQVVLLVCDRPGARAVELAREQGIPVALLDHRAYPNRLAHEREIAAALRHYRIDLVVMAGYMRRLTPFLLGFLYDPELGQSRIINIHPADTALYQGADGYGWAIASGQPATAVTVHYVDEGMDTGQVILRAQVPIYPGDTAATLAARGLTIEHQTYPAGIRKVLAHFEELQTCVVS